MRLDERTASAVGLALTLALGAACSNDTPGGVRQSDKDEQRSAAPLAFSDSEVVAALKAPEVAGRIIYDAPTDLSLANATRMRPDLVRGDTTRRDTSGSATRRDSTGGDATADTSGGAARRRRP